MRSFRPGKAKPNVSKACGQRSSRSGFIDGHSHWASPSTAAVPSLEGASVGLCGSKKHISKRDLQGLVGTTF